MTRFRVCGALALVLGACAGVQTSATEQAGMELQGMELQGMELQGMELQGTSMQGFQVTGATQSGCALTHVRIQKGEILAERNGDNVRGTGLVGAHFFAQTSNAALVEFRITAIQAEAPQWDPTSTGHTFLYTLQQWVDDSSSWQPACAADSDGRQVAIPVAATWDVQGNRVESSSLFTFGCTTGVIAKCYRWGYRPWLNGYGDMVSMHQTCTRLARADYCGIGVPGTRNGTTINVWDQLPPPGPIQSHGGGLLQLPPTGMLFEAGWNVEGAVCLSHSRWVLDDGPDIAKLCPDRLVPPGLLGETVCDTVSDVVGLDPNARMFNEAYLNLVGP